jgi:hypothetical protein
MVPRDAVAATGYVARVYAFMHGVTRPRRQLVLSSPKVKPPRLISFTRALDLFTPLSFCRPQSQVPLPRRLKCFRPLSGTGTVPAGTWHACFHFIPVLPPHSLPLLPSHSLAPREPDLFVYFMYQISVRSRPQAICLL